MRYWLHLQRCRKRYHPCGNGAASEKVLQAVYKFRNEGFVLIDPPDDNTVVQQIASRCAQGMDAGQVTITEDLEEWMIHLQYCIRNIPELFQLFHPDLVKVIEGCFKSHFKIYSATAYRLVPTKDAPQASGLWHADDFPPGALKLMVYLTPSTQETGAFRLHPRSASRRLARLGFFDRFKAEKFSQVLNNGWFPIEGPAGATILFDPRLVHRATPPEHGLRDIVSFTLLPSREPWQKHGARVGEGVCREYRQMIPLNPALD